MPRGFSLNTYGGMAYSAPISSTPQWIQDASYRSTDPFSDVVGDITNQGCQALGVPDSICRLGAAAVNQWLGGGGGGSSSGASQLVADCPEGFRLDPETGRCLQEGVRGAIERFLPGGQAGTLADEMGQPVIGAFGQAGVIPAARGTIQRADGSTGPILKCPRGMVLGKDDICYAKSVVPRKFRKWAPAARPPVSAGDAKAIRKADSARNRVKNLAKKSGFSCKKR